MKQRYMLKCAVFLILTKKIDGKEFILLQKRYNTGLLDNMYDVSCSGHLESDETLIQAMIRETKEEIGIDINKDNLSYSSTMHAKFDDSEYLLVTFSTNIYDGEPTIMEPNKCNELLWVDINDLPKDIINTRKIMINNYKNNIPYCEYGFND